MARQAPAGGRLAALPLGAVRRGGRRRGRRGGSAARSRLGGANGRRRAASSCRELALALREQREELSEIVAAETGKSLELARGETDAAIEMGFFVAGEGRRSYGRTTTASDGAPDRRCPCGSRSASPGSLISFNTPLPNVAWKVFPAILCGNACVLKPSEHTPASAHALRASSCREAGLPPGVLNVVQGLGPEAGAALVEHPDVDLVSFTGSAATGPRG